MRLNGLLRQLEEIWREAGDDATLAALQPGLTPAAFLTQGEEVGLTLPIELQTWFEWHDGGVPHPGYGPRIGASHLEFISLRGAVELYRFQCDFTRDLAAEYAQGGIAPTMAELGWDPSWFPIFVGGSGDVAGVDCSARGEMGSPIRVVEWTDHDKLVVDATSLEEVVDGWIEMYRAGVYRWHPGNAEWQTDWAAVSQSMSPFA